MTDSTLSQTRDPNEKTILGHPRGLFILFLTEMWERFSYYGMRGLLIVYLTQHFLFSDERSSIIYGAYTALVYIMTIIGGTLADRYLGSRKAVTFGAILLVLGHFGMAFEGSGSTQAIVIDGKKSQLEADGRGNRQRLFTNYDGSTTRLKFETQTTLTVSSASGDTFKQFDGGKFNPEDNSIINKPEFVFETDRRPLVANLCNTFGLNFCAGEEPLTKVDLDGLGSYMVSKNASDERTITIDGNTYSLAESSVSLLNIVNDNNTVENEDDTVLRTFQESQYSVEAPVQDQFYVNILYLSLALIIAGVGYLKANISTIVGSLYGVGDKRRDSGFTIFYMGINLGSFLASLTCGILGIVYGWKYGFGLAGIGMLAGLYTFWKYQAFLEGNGEPPHPENLKRKVLGPINVEWACYLVALIIIGVAMLGLMNPDNFGKVAGYLGLAMFAVLVIYAFFALKGQERGKMFAAIYFVLAQIPFWALFEQAGSSLNLFTDRLVDKTMFGWDVPAPVFQSLNAGYIFLFAPLVAWLWLWLEKRNLNPSTPVKFAFGVALAGLGFLALVGGMKGSGSTGYTAVYFIFLIYWIHTMGELLVSPVGLSAVTKMAPVRVVGMTMGAWFLYSGLSNFLAGVISRTTGAETIGGQITNVAAAKAGYVAVYTQVGYVALGIALIMLLISPLIKKLMHGAD